jgi:nucleoside diphosphate kinase
MESFGTTIIIKPDAFSDNIDRLVIMDLVEAGIKVVWEKHIQIPEEAVRYLYADQTMKPFYSSIVRSITIGTSLILVAVIDDISRLRKIKGVPGISGIRGKYCLSKEALLSTGLSGKNLEDKVSQNRIHTPDSFAETAIILQMFFTDQEIEMIKLHPAFSFLEKFNRIIALPKFSE